MDVRTGLEHIDKRLDRLEDKIDQLSMDRQRIATLEAKQNGIITVLSLIVTSVVGAVGWVLTHMFSKGQS